MSSLKLPIWIGAVTLLCVISVATASEPEEATQPVVSDLGRKRILENLQLLDNSIADLKANLQATRHNLQTIQSDLSNFQKLEGEHVALKKKYLNYLSFANSQINKNEETIRELARWESQQKSLTEKINDKQIQQRVGAAKKELADRGAWKADATSKTERVKVLIRELDSNIRTIRSLKAPLEQQLHSWNKRLSEYQELYEKTSRKRKELESLAKR